MLAAYAVRSGRPVASNADEADAPFDDERVVASGDDVSESHAPDRVGREPRLHADLDPESRPAGPAANGGFDADDEIGRAGRRGRRRRRSRLGGTESVPPAARGGGAREVGGVEGERRASASSTHSTYGVPAGRPAMRSVSAGDGDARVRHRSAAAGRRRQRTRPRARSVSATSRPMARLSRRAPAHTAARRAAARVRHRRMPAPWRSTTGRSAPAS